MEVFFGISAADGTGIGPAFRIPETVKRAIPQKKIDSSQIETDWNRFEKAIKTVTADVSATSKK